MLAFLSVLKASRTNLVNELRHVDAALAVLGKLGVGSNFTRSSHTLSASARRRISLAQKARWAKVRGGSKPTLVAKTESAPAKRKMSAAGRKRIAAAQKARWAAVRAAQKKAA